MDPSQQQPGTRQMADSLVQHVGRTHPRKLVYGSVALAVVLVIVIVIAVVYYNKYETCHKKGTFLGSDPLGNLNTGNNNPMWQGQMGGAGWGGSMHSTYQPGQPRVWGASAEGPHSMAVVPVASQSCAGGVSRAALGEGQALVAAQALDPAPSARDMTDDALVSVMNGGV